MCGLTGKTLGRYHIIEPLGEGGMAAVYKAFDTTLERNVAVKVIRTDREQDPTFLRRFEREAKSLARLTHPNIVNVSDYGEHEGMPYVVMDYLPGGTLKGMLGQPMPYQQAARLLAPVARALHYAHACKIIHRDVKPANILITESGEPMLSDFGIAKMLESDGATQLTGTGVGIGTPDYMAPEQWMGRVEPRTDVYALGILFYELVTGRLPYKADTPAAVLIKHVNDPLPRPRDFVPDLPEAVEQVIYKALAKTPEERYETMGLMAVALERLLQGVEDDKPVAERVDQRRQAAAPAPLLQEAPPAPELVSQQPVAAAASDVQKSRRRFPLLLAAGAAGVLLLVVGIFAAGLILGPRLLSGGEAEKTAATPTITPFPTPVTDYTIGGVLFEDNFEGQPSSRWYFQPQQWQVEMVEGRSVLRNAPLAESGGQNWSMMTASDTAWVDYAFQFDFKFLEPDENGEYYLTARTRTGPCPQAVMSQETYTVTISPETVRLERGTCDEQWRVIGELNRSLAVDEWHTVLMAAIGPRVQVFIDGNEYFNIIDEQPIMEHEIWIETNGAGIEFLVDNVRVNQLTAVEDAAGEAPDTAAPTEQLSDGAEEGTLPEIPAAEHEEICSADAHGCVSFPPDSAVKIGVAAPLSGDLAIYGEAYQQAALLALEDMGKIGGYAVELVFMDDGGSADQASAVAEELAADKKVVAVAGHVTSTACESAIHVYERYGIPMMSPSATNEELTQQGYQVFNRLLFSDPQQAQETARFILSLGVKQIVILHDDTYYNTRMKDLLNGHYRESGGDVAASFVLTGDTDLADAGGAVAEAGGFVYYCGFQDPYMPVEKLVGEAGINPAELTLMGCDSVFDMGFDAGLESLAAVYSASMLPPLNTPERQVFVERYAAKYDVPPDELSSMVWYFYDSVMALKAGLEYAAHMTNGVLFIPRGAAVGTVRGTRGFHGLTGTITCNDVGECNTSGPFFYMLEGGEWIPVGE